MAFAVDTEFEDCLGVCWRLRAGYVVQGPGPERRQPRAYSHPQNFKATKFHLHIFLLHEHINPRQRLKNKNNASIFLKTEINRRNPDPSAGCHSMPGSEGSKDSTAWTSLDQVLVSAQAPGPLRSCPRHHQCPRTRKTAYLEIEQTHCLNTFIIF